MDRRRFIRLAAGAPIGLTGVLGAGCAREGSLAPSEGAPSPTPIPSPGEGVVVPKVNGGINLQPLRRLDPRDPDAAIVPDLVALQLRAVYELGFDGIRVTAPFSDRSNFLAAIPYVRAARALGIDAVVVLADFAGLSLARALFDDRRRPAVLRLYQTVFGAAPLPVRPGLGGLGPGGVGRVAFQILNEPAHFLGVPPEVYVRELLTPCFVALKLDAPDIIVVAAAEVGNVDGPPRIRAMLEAGLEYVSDRVAYHIYSRAVIPLLAPHVKSLVWVTESGAAGTGLHLGWVRDTFPEIFDQIPDVSRIFYFDLFDGERGVYRLLDIQPDGPGFRAVVESTDLHAFLADKVRARAGGQPLLGFDALIPDIRAYFPTAADLLAYEEASRA
jgi:hypothetical protein